MTIGIINVEGNDEGKKAMKLRNTITSLRGRTPRVIPHLELRLLVNLHCLRKIDCSKLMKIPLFRVKFPVPHHRLFTVAEFIQARALAARFTSRESVAYGGKRRG
jgi:hypothetical protein